MARPSLKFTDEDRKLVEEMSGFGVPFENIASLIGGGIERNTLTKHFKNELMQGKAKANSKIGRGLFQKAMDGDTSALIFWAKTQMRWREIKEEQTTIDVSALLLEIAKNLPK